MKRNIKNSSKRKWIVGGVAFFGAVALLTTGFATWVIGVNQTSSDLEVGVTVDSAKNESVKFTANVKENDTLTLAEDTTENNASGLQNNIIKIEKGSATPDFTVVVEYTVDIGSSLKATGITFTMTPIAATSSLTSTEVPSGLEDRGTNYIEFAETDSTQYTYDFDSGVVNGNGTYYIPIFMDKKGTYNNWCNHVNKTCYKPKRAIIPSNRYDVNNWKSDNDDSRIVFNECKYDSTKNIANYNGQNYIYFRGGFFKYNGSGVDIYKFRNYGANEGDNNNSYKAVVLKQDDSFYGYNAWRLV